MATPARNKNTLLIRQIANAYDRLPETDVQPVEEWDEEEVTRTAIECEVTVPDKKTLGDQWHDVHPVLKGAALIVPILAAAIAQIISAMK